MLYLIEILHQTTTYGIRTWLYSSCILLKFYIKPQLFRIRSYSAIVVSYWNSTSNHNYFGFAPILLYVVSYWNSTSNHNRANRTHFQSKVVSYWNSTSNHNFGPKIPAWTSVVSYWNSTSNHNSLRWRELVAGVVSYWNSTSNHNFSVFAPTLKPLYLIEILHQTTTGNRSSFEVLSLYLIEILHQTTTETSSRCFPCGCILLKFYIKPQLEAAHNRIAILLYLIEILHQTTTLLFRLS